MTKLRTAFLALLMMLAMAGTFLLSADTASAAKPNVTADSKYFDISSGCYVLTGNVRVEIGERIITADKAMVNLLSMEVTGEGHINLISTEDDITFSGDSVTVIGRETRALVTGHASFQQGETAISSEAAFYNWGTKLADFRQKVRLTLNGNKTKHDSLTYHVIDRTVVNADPAL